MTLPKLRMSGPPRTILSGAVLCFLIAFVWKYHVVHSDVQVIECGDSSLLVPCFGPKPCARSITHNAFSTDDVDLLRELVDTALEYTGGGNGPPSIVDMASGATSKGDSFINIFNTDLVLPNQHIYKKAVDAVRDSIELHYGECTSLKLTKPSFFSRIDGSKTAKTPHDEYWHPHVDKQTYGSFVITGLVYLSDAGVDFEGGLFNFLDGDGKVQTVTPKRGTLVWFTSGSENLHHVQPVLSGVRYALTIAFTCSSN